MLKMTAAEYERHGMTVLTGHVRLTVAESELTPDDDASANYPASSEGQDELKAQTKI